MMIVEYLISAFLIAISVAMATVAGGSIEEGKPDATVGALIILSAAIGCVAVWVSAS